MFFLAMYILVFLYMFYITLRIFLPSHKAKTVVSMTVLSSVILLFAMIPGILFTALLGDVDYMRRATKGVELFSIVKDFDVFVDGRAMAWYLLKPVVVFIQIIAIYLHIVVMHTTIPIIITQALALFILNFEYRCQSASH